MQRVLLPLKASAQGMLPLQMRTVMCTSVVWQSRHIIC